MRAHKERGLPVSLCGNRKKSLAEKRCFPLFPQGFVVFAHARCLSAGWIVKFVGYCVWKRLLARSKWRDMLINSCVS